jgi:hypothetical protein
MDIFSFLSSGTTKENIEQLLCDTRTNNNRPYGNIELTELILKRLKILAGRQSGKNYFMFPVVECVFVKQEDTYVENIAKSELIGWFFSATIDGYLDSGFWVKEKLIPLLLPMYNGSVPPPPNSNKKCDTDSYKCIGTNALLVQLDAEGESMLQQSLVNGFFFATNKPAMLCPHVKGIPLTI